MNHPYVTAQTDDERMDAKAFIHMIHRYRHQAILQPRSARLTPESFVSVHIVSGGAVVGYFVSPYIRKYKMVD